MRDLTNSGDKFVRDIAMKHDKKDEFFHSSSYGSAQNGGNIGTASTGLTMEERKAIEEKRKYVTKYNESQLFSGTFSLRHAKKYNPNAQNTPAQIAHNRENTTGDASGNVRQSFGRTTGGDEIGIGNSATAKKPGEASGYTPFKSSSAPSAPSRPSPAASFSANIKPSFK